MTSGGAVAPRNFPVFPSAYGLDRTGDAVEGQREHAVVEYLPDHSDGLGVLPITFRKRIQPDVVRPFLSRARQPDLSGLGVPVLVGSAGVGDFVR